jgi:hypothetical protein
MPGTIEALRREEAADVIGGDGPQTLSGALQQGLQYFVLGSVALFYAAGHPFKTQIDGSGS